MRKTVVEGADPPRDPEAELRSRATSRAYAIRQWAAAGRNGSISTVKHGPRPGEDEIAAAVAWKPGDEPVPVQCVQALTPAGS